MIDEAPLTAYLDATEIVIVTARCRLAEVGHDLLPVCSVCQRLAAMDQDSYGMCDFMGDGLLDGNPVIAGDRQIETYRNGDEFPWLSVKQYLSGATAGQIKSDDRRSPVSQFFRKKLLRLLPVVIDAFQYAVPDIGCGDRPVC